MNCPWCSYENQPRARFCGNCGRALGLDAVCASYSTANPVGHRFCDACGAELAASPESTPAVDMPVERPRSSAASAPAAAPAPTRRLPSVGWPKLAKPGLVWDQPAPQWRWSWSHIAAWAGRNRFELAAVALLTILAGIIRIYRVTELPVGLHGDEALTGIDALRIIEEGWIGPYVGSALGQPTGPLHFTALVFELSDPTTFTLHLSMALLGIATIPATYLLMRIGFGRWVALFAAAALTFSYWHVFFSRSAFMLISMPLMTTIAAAAILIALRSQTRWAWLIAGIVLGLGVYSYNGYVMFLAVAAVFLVLVLVLGRERPEALRSWSDSPRHWTRRCGFPADPFCLLGSRLLLPAPSYRLYPT